MQVQHAGRAAERSLPRMELDADTLSVFLEGDYARLIGLAALVCRGEVEPADVVQSALEQAWRHRRSLRNLDRLRPWLDRILVREALRMRRRRLRLPIARPPREGRELELAAKVGVEPAEWAGLGIALNGLSREQRATVVLHLYAGYSIDETATMTGAGIETTRSRLRLAKERLRTTLSQGSP